MKPEKWRTRRKSGPDLFTLCTILWVLMSVEECVCTSNLCNRPHGHSNQEDSIDISHQWISEEHGYIPGVVYQVTIPIPSNLSIEGVMVRSILKMETHQNYNRPVKFGQLTHEANGHTCGDGSVVFDPENYTSEVNLSWQGPTNTHLTFDKRRALLTATVIHLGNVYKYFERTLMERHKSYRYKGCYAYHNTTSGIITSPNYPHSYPKSVEQGPGKLECHYYIEVPENRKVFLQFQDFDVEEEENCSFDSVNVTTSENKGTYVAYAKQTMAISGPLCGTKTDAELGNLAFISDTNYMVIKFTSDGREVGRGFNAVFYAVDETGSFADCNITHEATATSQTFRSFNHTGEYLPNLSCQYDIIAEGNLDMVSVKIDKLHIQGKVDGLCKDYLRIETMTGNGTMATDLCGKRGDYLEKELHFVSRKYVKITFSTDSLVQGLGFSIQYQGAATCKNNTTYTQESGQLTSLFYPEPYQPSQNCIQIIKQSSDSYMIQLKLVLHTYGPRRGTGLTSCVKDWIQIDSGQGPKRYCGDWTDEPHLQFNGSQIILHFVTDTSGSITGYKADWQMVLKDPSHVLCEPGWYSFYIYCYKLYAAPLLTWEEASKECRSIGAYLLEVRSQTQQDALTTLVRGLNMMAPVWIGASDAEFERYFFWEDESPVEYTNWFPGWGDGQSVYNKQPSDDGTSESDCVEMKRSFYHKSKGIGTTDELYWNDRPCSARNSFICQKKKPKYFAEGYQNRRVKCSKNITLTVNEPSVEFKSPKCAPGNYCNFLNCEVYVDTGSPYAIEVEFHEFVLEGPDQKGKCLYDYVQISSANLQQRYCGNMTYREKLLRQISPTGGVLLQLTSDHAISYAGIHVSFNLMIEKEDCDSSAGWTPLAGECFKVENKEEKSLTQAQAIAECEYMNSHLLSTNDTEAVHIKRRLTELLPADEISFWLQVSFGGDRSVLSDFNISGETTMTVKMATTSSPGSPQCLSLQNPNLNSNDIIFKEDNCSERMGYICIKRRPDEIIKANYATINQSEGYLSWPPEPGMKYGDDLNMTWVISTTPQHGIYIMLDVLDIEHQPNCLYDSLHVIAGDKPPETLSDNDTFKIFCGNLTNVTFPIYSEQTTIRLSSDFSVGGGGFLLRWSSFFLKDSYVYTGQAGSFTSVNYPYNYLPNLHYNISIAVLPNQRVWLDMSFLQFDDTFGNCSDYLLVFLGAEGEVLGSKDIYNGRVKLCASTTSGRELLGFVSSGDTMRLLVHTDHQGSSRGFQASYQAVPSVNFTKYQTLSLNSGEVLEFSTPNYPANLPDSFHQIINLVAPLGCQIKVRILDLKSTNNSTCLPEESLLFIDDLVPDSLSLKNPTKNVICGTDPLPTYVSFLNELRIEFHSENQSLVQPTFHGALVRLEVTRDRDFVNKTKYDLGVALINCSDNVCFNGGVCTSAAPPLSGFQCQCTAHYGGLLCAWDHCQRDTCRNDGACTLTDTGFNCTCRPPFGGSRCEMDLMACANEQCSGHGDCILGDDDTITCSCSDGYTGTTCSSPLRVPIKSAQMRLLQEPFWIGIIVVFGVLAITGVVVFIKRKCAAHFDIDCCEQTLKRSSSKDEKSDAGASSDRRWSFQFPEGYGNYGYSSTEGTPRPGRLEQQPPIMPEIKIVNEHSQTEVPVTAEVTNHEEDHGVSSDCRSISPSNQISKADDLSYTIEEEGAESFHDYQQKEGRLHIMDDSEVSFPGVPVIHLHRAKSACSREPPKPQERLAFRRCYSSDAKLSESDESDTDRKTKGRRSSTTFPGAVTLGDGQTLNVVAYDGPINSDTDVDSKSTNTLKAPSRSLAESENSGLDSPMVCHKRVNSAQRRKDFANSVRRAREITHILLDGNCQSNNSSWGSRGCKTCGGSPSSTVSLTSHSKECRESHGISRYPSYRSYDGCSCSDKLSLCHRSRRCSACSDGSFEHSPLGSQQVGTIESASSGYYSRHSSYQHQHRHRHRHRRHNSEGRSHSSSSRRHRHHQHRSDSRGSKEGTSDSRYRSESHLNQRSDSNVSTELRRRRHKHSRSSSHHRDGSSRTRDMIQTSQSVEYGNTELNELHRLLTASLSTSSLNRGGDSDHLRESTRSTMSAKEARRARKRHERHGSRQEKRREHREDRHSKEHRHRKSRSHRDRNSSYIRDSSPPEERTSRYQPGQFSHLHLPGQHKPLSRAHSGDWQLIDGRLVMYVDGHRKLESTRSDTSTDSRRSVPDVVHKTRSHLPLKKSKSMDIRPKEPSAWPAASHPSNRPNSTRDNSLSSETTARSGVPSTVSNAEGPHLMSSLSSGSMDTPYSLSRRDSLFSRTESQSSLPPIRQLLLVPQQDSALLSDPDSYGGNSSENSGSGKAEIEAQESSSGISTDIHSYTSKDLQMDALEDSDQPNGAGWVSIPSIDLNNFLSPDSAVGRSMEKSPAPEVMAVHSGRGSPMLQGAGADPRAGSPDFGDEDPESPSKHPLRDSAYQSKEQSTEKCNSRPNSNAVSPTLSNGQGELYARYKAALLNGPEDKRVTSQLEMAAKKLSVFGNAQESSDEEEGNLGDPSEDESMQVQNLDQPSISGTLSFFFHNAHCLTHTKPRRLFPTRMLSMIADEESEMESPVMSPLHTQQVSGVPSPDLQSPPPTPMDPVSSQVWSYPEESAPPRSTTPQRPQPDPSPQGAMELSVMDAVTSDDASDDRSEETCFTQQTEECVRVEVEVEDVTGKDSATDV